MVNLITDNIDVWTSAHKPKSNRGRGRGAGSSNQNPQGIKKLRELILELAFRGKLAPQNPTDEPASVLLEKIAKEKVDLIKQGKIKKQKPLPEITEDEKPFKQPDGWEWVRLGKFCEIKGGKRLPKGHTFSTVKTPYIYIRVTNMKEGSITQDGHKYISRETQKEISRYTISKNDLYITIAGTIGDVGIVPECFDGMNLTENAAKIIFDRVEKIWFQKALSSLTMQRQFAEKTNQLAQPKLALHRVASSCIALPPLAEQHRIVAKVDELMALCDKLEQQQMGSIAAHKILVETLLATLNDAADHTDLTAAWKRVANHFDTLFTTEHSIDQLKQTILQLAVMGKLVPQDPKDEPAGDLLEKIAKEQTRLIKTGKIKKQKPLPEITDNEKPFELPLGWKWARPDDFSQKITDGEHFRPQTQDVGVYFLSAKDIRSDGISLEDPLYISEQTAEIALQRCNPETGDLLIVSRGATVGRMCTVDISVVFCLLGSVILIKPQQPMLSDYLKIVMKTPQAFKKLVSASGSTAQPAIYLRDLKKIIFPIAPLKEQYRIIAKVDELMALCDQLNARLNEAQTTQIQLADAIDEKAVA